MEQYNLLDVPHLIYVMDPMCSWCYGFAPQLQKLKQAQEDKLKFKLVMGGLRPGTTKPMDTGMRDSIRHHWQEVEKATEQPFNYTLLERNDFVYDTEPACRAVITMRYLKPEAELEMAEAIQNAFYAQGSDVTQPAILAAIATQFDVTEEEFLEMFNSELMLEKTQQDFLIARHLQANAFPSLYLLNGHQVSLLSRGYRLFEALNSRLQEALRNYTS
ncbi:DsbA family protein [Pontibacter sp. 172403-2]|uniref:DsbA family protein n=1 Tax=Pontibacter rufus TaxID=2791028 RepID=UPI0018AFD427|nr:DsbA family protein [Pontibacter sp. 172403-2]MBF9253628.1 DsbA family protein [Pontibacter sp. 172403-2]